MVASGKVNLIIAISDDIHQGRTFQETQQRIFPLEWRLGQRLWVHWRVLLEAIEQHVDDEVQRHLLLLQNTIGSLHN